MDAGFDVVVADAAGIEVDDDETIRYFRELSQGLLVGARSAAAGARPVRVVDDLAPAAARPRRVEPFIGSGLQDWATDCLASPYGFLYSRVTERKAVTMRSSRGEPFEVTAIGSIETGPGQPQLVLGDWLTAQAGHRGIDVNTDSPLQRIVFDEGHALGAVLATPSGPRAVRARRGVLVSTGGHDAGARLVCDVPEEATLQVSVLRLAPSRFGRVELLTTRVPAGAPRATCRATSRHLLDTARGTLRHSPNWRCGELHRYPPLGK
ncbi:MAG: hypothetical protein WAL26_14285 [Mycobacterium sp.]